MYVWEAAGNKILRITPAHNPLHNKLSAGCLLRLFPCSTRQPITGKQHSGAQTLVSREPSDRGGNRWALWLWVVLKAPSCTSLSLTQIPSKASAQSLARPLAGGPATASKPVVVLSVLVLWPRHGCWHDCRRAIMRLQNPSKATSHFT